MKQGQQSQSRTPNALAASRSGEDKYLVGNLTAMPSALGFSRRNILAWKKHSWWCAGLLAMVRQPSD